ncbi:hypothetical protein [Polaribacter sp.]|uniref:hypothetical protein n=1 Tax=Polaribacter sp. TaxID=1920175 RepID=UPI004047F657
MKKIKNIKSLIAFSAIAISIFILSCDFKGVTDDFDIVINNSIFKQQVIVELFDPVNQANLEADNILKVEVLGRDADKIVTDAGENVSTSKFSRGAIALAVNPNKNPTNEPVEFILKVTGTNYLTTTIPVFLSDTDSIATLSANLVNKLNTPKGVDYVKETKSLVNNTLPTNVSIETSGTKAETKSEVTIEAGTIFQDANGNPISGTQIVSEIVNFNSKDPESLASFPGGFMPQQITDENGQIVEDAYFETAGFVSIDMQIGNKEVKKFSKPITIKMQVAADYINPETGSLIKVGDIIPIWSYSKDDGTWEYHTKGTVKLESGNFVVEYTTTHLSWYNLDYYGRRCPTGWRYVNRRWVFQGNNTSISIRMNGISSNNSISLYSDFVFAGTNQSVSYWSGKTYNWFDGQKFDLLNTPDRNLQMVVYSGNSRYNRGIELFRSQSFNPCGGTINIDVSSIVSKLPPPPVNVYVRYKAKCNGKVIEPTIPLYMKDPTRGYWRYMGYVYRGQITLRGIQLNTPYEFSTYYRGKFYNQTITFDKTEYINDNYQIPTELCNSLF